MNHGGDIYSHKVNIDFSVSLNPMGTPDLVQEAFVRGLAHMSEYPDLEQRELRLALSKADGVPPMYIRAGNGASELITAVTALVRPKHAVLIEPSFTGYRHALDSVNCTRITELYLKEEKGFCFDEEVSEGIPEDADMLFLTNPVNPTGYNIPKHVLSALLDKCSEKEISVLLDESFLLLSDGYDPFRDLMGMMYRHDKLFIVRSYTKLFASPGIRMGYVISLPRNINALCDILPEWNVSVVSDYGMRAGSEQITKENFAFLRDSMNLISDGKAYLRSELRNLGIRAYESDTLYMLIRSELPLYEKLLEKGILIRDLKDHPGLGEGFARIAVRNEEDNRSLVAAIKEIRDEMGEYQTGRHREEKL